MKLPLYAAAGVPEVWIANLSDNVLLVSRDLSGKNYTTQLTIGRGGSVSPLAFPDDVFQVEDIIG